MTPGAVLLEQGASAAPARIHQTAYQRLHDAASEAEVERHRARDSGRVMYHAQTGSTDWATTVAVLQEIEGSLGELGMACDRFGLTPVAGDERAGDRSAAACTRRPGPRLKPEDWDQLGEAAAIQPHLGDFMIGTPGGVRELAGRPHRRRSRRSATSASTPPSRCPAARTTSQVTEEAIRSIGLLAALP